MKTTATHSAWSTPHELAEGACPKCQGTSYVPGRPDDGRLVETCPECEGTGKDEARKAA